jgi:hypothetical protein
LSFLSFILFFASSIRTYVPDHQSSLVLVIVALDLVLLSPRLCCILAALHV